MRCFSCNKNFDYEKYYGICPKCGCYNKPETSQEQHQAYHDLYDGGYTHGEEHYNTYTEFKKETGQRPSVFVRELERAARPEKDRKGNGLLIASVVFVILSILAFVIVSIASAAGTPEPDAPMPEHAVQEIESGEIFYLQDMSLEVVECRILADWTTQENLEPGKKLVGIRVAGTSDGAYEAYNRLADPYLEVDGSYYRPLSEYEFEPYAVFYQVTPLLDESALMYETSCDGWYAFVVDAESTGAALSFEDCVWDDWEKKDVITIYSVKLELEGGVADEEQ